MLRIGEVAERVRVSLRTLRHDDATGLLPSSGHSEGGGRLCTADHYHRVVIAQGMTAQGCSLERADRFILTLEERRTAGGAAVRPVSLGTPVLPSLWCRAMMERFGGRIRRLGPGAGRQGSGSAEVRTVTDEERGSNG